MTPQGIAILVLLFWVGLHLLRLDGQLIKLKHRLQDVEGRMPDSALHREVQDMKKLTDKLRNALRS